MEIKDLGGLVSLLNLGKSQALPEGKEEFANILGAETELLSKDREFFASKDVVAKEPVNQKNKKPNKLHKPKSDKSVTGNHSDNKAVAKDVSKPENNKVSEPVDDTLEENQVTSKKEAITEEDVKNIVDFAGLAFISSQEVVEFIHPVTGETMTMSGEELAAKILSGEMPLLPKENILQPSLSAEQIPSLNDSELKVIAETKDSDAGIELKGFESVLEEKFVEAKNNADVDLSPETTSKFAEVMPNNKKAKLDVKVTSEEEKISPSSNKDLLSQDTKVLVDEVSSAEVENEVAIESPQNSAPQSEPENNIEIVADEIEVADVRFNADDAKNIVNNTPVSTASSLRGDSVSHNNKVDDSYKGMSKEVVEQVKVNITKSAVKGIDKIDIQLKPAGLGNVEVKLTIAKDGKLQAQIISSRQDTMDILQKDAVTLEKALNEAGFETKDGSLSFSFRDEQSNNRENNLRSFIGNALDQEDALTGANSLQESHWDGKSSLNIRV